MSILNNEIKILRTNSTYRESKDFMIMDSQDTAFNKESQKLSSFANELPQVLDILKTKEKLLNNEKKKKEKIDQRTLSLITDTKPTQDKISISGINELIQENGNLVAEFNRGRKKYTLLIKRFTELEKGKAEQEAQLYLLREKHAIAKKQLEESRAQINLSSEELKNLFDILKSLDKRGSKSSNKIFESSEEITFEKPDGLMRKNYQLLASKKTASIDKELLKIEEEILQTSIIIEEKDTSMEAKRKILNITEKEKLIEEISKIKQQIKIIEKDNENLIQKISCMEEISG